MRRGCPWPPSATSGGYPDFQDPATLIYPGRMEKMAPLTDQLVGRAEEFGLLDRVLTEVDQGRAAAVELIGEPGIGKTRLLAEFAARADARGRLVLSGSASEFERDLPFSV